MSIFKPVRLGGELLRTGPVPRGEFDSESLYWRHERLHRTTLLDYEKRKAVFDAERAAMQARFLAPGESGPGFQECWDEHLSVIEEWGARVEQQSKLVRRRGKFRAYWEKQNELDGIPVTASPRLLAVRESPFIPRRRPG